MARVKQLLLEPLYLIAALAILLSGCPMGLYQSGRHYKQIERHSAINKRIIIAIMITLACCSVAAQTDTLVIQKKDTLVYLIPIKQLHFNQKVTQSNAIA